MHTRLFKILKAFLSLIVALAMTTSAFAESPPLLGSSIFLKDTSIDPLATEYPAMLYFSPSMYIRDDISQQIISSLLDDKAWKDFNSSYAKSATPYGIHQYYSTSLMTQFFIRHTGTNIVQFDNKIFIEQEMFQKTFSAIGREVIVPDEYATLKDGKFYVCVQTYEELTNVLLANENTDIQLSSYVFPKVVSDTATQMIRPDLAVKFIEAFCNYENQIDLNLYIKIFKGWGLGITLNCGQIVYPWILSILQSFWVLFEVPTIRFIDEEPYFDGEAIQYAFESVFGEPLVFSDEALSVYKNPSHELIVSIDGKDFYSDTAICGAIDMYAKYSPKNMEEYQQN